MNPGTVLVVCTGNVCRSPYLERRLRQELAGTGIRVESAGTHAMVGRDMDPGTRALLAALGADTGGFAARDLTPELMAGADLVVTAAREHRAGATRLHPAALRRTITLRDLADLLRGVPGEELRASAPRRHAVGAARARQRARRAGARCPPVRTGSTSPTPSGSRRRSSRGWPREVDDALGPVVAALRAGPAGA